jgi:predicted Zn-dependent protease
MAGRFSQRGFDRDQEIEADRFGLELLAAEYGHTAGIRTFFEHLPETEGSLVGTLSSYLSTHPLHEDRVDALEESARLAGWSLSGELAPLSADFASTDGD